MNHMENMNKVSVWLGVEQGIRGGCVGIWLDLPETKEQPVEDLGAMLERMRKTIESPEPTEQESKSPEGPAKVLHMKLTPVPREFLVSHRYQVIRDKWRPLPTRRLPVVRIDSTEEVLSIAKTRIKSNMRDSEILHNLCEIVGVPTDELPRCACGRFFK